MNDDNIDKYIDLSLCNKKFGISDHSFRGTIFFKISIILNFLEVLKNCLNSDFFRNSFLRDKGFFKSQIILNFLEVQEVVC